MSQLPNSTAAPGPVVSKPAGTGPGAIADKIVLLLVNGMTVEAATGFCLKSGLTPEQAGEAVRVARKRITVAADYAREEQIGRAVMRLEDLYAKAVAGQDLRTALQAQKELHRLMSLYGDAAKPGEADAGETASASLDLVGQYLLPLNLIGPEYPVEEHARIASEIIRQNGLSRV